MILCLSWSKRLKVTKASSLAVCLYVCVCVFVCLFVQAVWLPTVTRNGVWQMWHSKNWRWRRECVDHQEKPISTVCMWLIRIYRLLYSLERIELKGKTTQLKDQDSECQAMAIWSVCAHKVGEDKQNAGRYCSSVAGSRKVNAGWSRVLAKGVETDSLLRRPEFNQADCTRTATHVIS